MKKPARIKPADYERTRYFVACEPGTTMADITGTEFWANVAKSLRHLDVIEAVAMDGSFDVEMRLVSKTPAKLTWRILRASQTAEGAVSIETEQPQNFVVSHRGRGTYGVQKKSTGEWLAEGLSRQDAEAAAAEMEAERAAA